MDDSPFAKLPRELRDEIWKLALYISDGVNLCVSFTDSGETSSGFKVHHTNAKQSLALTRSCKQIRFETGTLFYAKNEFTLTQHFSDNVLVTSFVERHARITELCAAWLRSVGTKNSQAISKLVLHVRDTNDLPTLAYEVQNDLNQERHQRRDLGLRCLQCLLQPGSLCTRVTQEIWPCFDETLPIWHETNGQPHDIDHLHCAHTSVARQLLSDITHNVSGFDDAQGCKDIVENYKARQQEIEMHKDHQDCEIAKLLPRMPEDLSWPCFDMLQAMGLWQGHKSRSGIGHPREVLNGT